MTRTFEAGDITLQRVRENVWEIPPSGGMRVPARVLASETLLEEISGDKTLEQLRNTTHLPGIQSPAICMPDGHQGYGFPVGGVAGIDAEEGVISPGAVGYDINCLSGDAEVLLEFGRRRRIEDLAADFESERAVVAGDELAAAGIGLFTETADRAVYEVEMETGETIVATGDHQFSTPGGMQALDDLELGDAVYVHPFEGIRDEEPEAFTLLTEEDFADEDPQMVRTLQERDLLPLRSTDDAFAVLLKLVGFHTGDGSFSESSGRTWFYADPEDLEGIREDLDRLGFTASRIDERQPSHMIDGNPFETTEYSIRSTSTAFMKLVQKLGAPGGKTVESGFTLPTYFDRLAGWQQALYLSAFFGAEMTAPAGQRDNNLDCPKISHTRIAERANDGEAFLRGIARVLKDLGIETNPIERFEVDPKRDHELVRLRLGVKDEVENLVRFFTTVGYRYNRDKRRKAVEAVHYLRTKEAAINRREDIAKNAPAMADGGATPDEVRAEVDEVNERFLERSGWTGRNGRPRPGAEFPGFEEFCEEIEVRENLTVATALRSIEKRGTETVYDIGVDHEAHNFVANGAVVSNCGVRMVKTNLTYDDVHGREEELVDGLFAAIPTGLGGGGVLERDVRTVEAILDRGMDWAEEHGYAVPDDLAHCEDEGLRPESDPETVSQKAKERGATQIGSLGSGNHFLEVQRVTDIYRDDVADRFGLEEDQMVVLIHCGSRGLGHQVCTDYLREIEQRHADLLEELPDRELAAAPAGSRLADEYYRGMCAAINFAWVNRQLITFRTREVFEDVFGRDWEALGMDLLYDVAHNIAKREVHEVDGEDRELFVHRKGATRAFPAGRPEVPDAYRDVGQPVIIPGSMGSGSYVLRGGRNSLSVSWGSTAHGAGRLMSRTQAKREFWGGDVQDALRDQQHVYVKAQSGATIAEEAPGVYKDVDEVVRVSDALGIGDRVARTFPVCNIKG